MSTIKQSVAEKFAEHIPYHRRLVELEQVAARLGASPTDEGVVEMIVSRPAVEERRVLQHGVLDAVHGGLTPPVQRQIRSDRSRS